MCNIGIASAKLIIIAYVYRRVDSNTRNVRDYNIHSAINSRPTASKVLRLWAPDVVSPGADASCGGMLGDGKEGAGAGEGEARWAG